MAKFASWTLIGLYGLFCLAYSERILFDPLAKPSAATWLIFVVATGIAFASYRRAGNGDPVRGRLIIADAVSTWMIFTVLVLHSRSALRFTRLDVTYLFIAAMIGVFWSWSKKHIVANLLVQGLITIGYLPTIHKLLEHAATEPLYPWLLPHGASICGAVLAHMPAEQHTPKSRIDSMLSKVYAWRSIACTGTVILLLLFR